LLGLDGTDGKGSPVDRAALGTPLFAEIDGLIAVNEAAMFDFERRERNVARLMLAVVAGCGAGAILALVIFALVVLSLASLRMKRSQA